MALPVTSSRLAADTVWLIVGLAESSSRSLWQGMKRGEPPPGGPYLAHARDSLCDVLSNEILIARRGAD